MGGAEAAPRPAPAGKDRTLSDQVYETILSMILSGEIPVGAKLPSEHMMSDELNVSRPVLRQALKQLRENGVVVSKQGSGSYVQKRPETAAMRLAPVGSIADIQRTFEFRAAIEGEAAYLAAERRTKENLASLRATLEALDACIRNGELGVELDEAFHEEICEAAGNRYFAAARVSIKPNILMGLNLTRNLSLTKPQERMELVQQEHYAVLKALEAGDQDGARAAMRAHVENARNRVFKG
ncbi:FadR family transcriptional regulator [Alphaproteobacteria bacterium KMM 3653]|uniref:FadR family transcriptional regulator n=2 Tax=Harenicola maris TaxID=2841044 RepID=A0AAP2CSI2_9RHOB|nr:FadR family transcriptional regulator [Harenicola maris]